MSRTVRSIITAIALVACIQWLSVGVLSPYLPRSLCRPTVAAHADFTLENPGRIELFNNDGTVEVNVTRADEIRITADVQVSAADQVQAMAYFERLFAQRRAPGYVRIITEPGERPDTVDLRVDYVLWVPRATDVVIHGHNGNVSVGEGVGRVAVYGNNRDVEVVSPLGEVRVQNTNGRIQLTDAPRGGWLETVNGSIYAHVRGGMLEAKTTNGDIVATVLERGVAGCDLEATNGGITLAMPGRYPASVLAQTQHGVVRSEVPMDCSSGIEKRRELRGVIGGGRGVRLALSSTNGNIRITRSGS